MKKDYIYISIIILLAIVSFYAYKTKPEPQIISVYEKRIDSLNLVLKQKDTVINFHITKYNDLRDKIKNNPKPNYKPVPVSDRNSTIIKLSKK